MDFDRGLQALETYALNADEVTRQDVGLCKALLLENLEEEGRFGPTREGKNERARLIHRLNSLAERAAGMSFADLCLGKRAKQPPTPSDAQQSDSHSAAQTLRQRADILLVTVTEVEALAVLYVLQAQFGRGFQRRHIGDKTYYDLGLIGGAAVAMVQSEMGAGGPGAALLTVQKGIDALAPTAIIMLGIAFGMNPKKQRIGDVLVARQIVLYEQQRLGQSSAGGLELRMRGDRPSTSQRLLDKFRSGVLDWQQLDSGHAPDITGAAPADEHPAQAAPPSGKATPAHVQFGLVLSGEKLVDYQDFRDQLLMIEPEAIGAEMEGAGLYVAAADRKVDWILVKAICDWADGRKSRNKQQRQQLAARSAADFVFHVLQQGGMAP